MDANSVPVTPVTPVTETSQEIHQVIAQAHRTCQAEGPDSEACGLAWDNALTLQLEKFSQVVEQGSPNP